MNYQETASGQQHGWNLLEKLGEGDAGEVFRVDSLIDHRPAILKRPNIKSFPSDTIRQAAQIKKEGEILKVLANIDTRGNNIYVPTLLDQSKTGTEFSDRYFIVISIAPGNSLGQLARHARFSVRPTESSNSEQVQTQSGPHEIFLQEISQLKKIPDLIILRLITGLIDYLKIIHSLHFELPSGTFNGLIWNDIKTDHIFWDSSQLQFTLIDWGNGQFLELDGVSKDRLHSTVADFYQFIQEFGQFLSHESADLYEQLDWPQSFSQTNVNSALVSRIYEKANGLLQEGLAERRLIRRAEADLIDNPDLSIEDVKQIELTHQEIYKIGELPNFEGANTVFKRISNNLIGQTNVKGIAQLCEYFRDIHILNRDHADILQAMTRLVESQAVPMSVLSASIENDWLSAMWELRLAYVDEPTPAWWDELVLKIRNYALGFENLSPFIAVKRLLHALISTAPADDDLPRQEVIRNLRDVTLPRWTQIDPDPPDSGVGYQDVHEVLQSALLLSPGATQSVLHALSQVTAKAQFVLDAWNRRDFQKARNALRHVLLWDPNRLRLVEADNALIRAEKWVDEIQAGISLDEPLQEYITRQELKGRELRNQIGPAAWLDELLEAFRKLRKGSEPTDVLYDHEKLRADLGWLIALEPRRPLLAAAGQSIHRERRDGQAQIASLIHGIKESRVGSKAGILLSHPLDTWTPEARGSSARVFEGIIPNQRGHKTTAAIKMMRPDQIEYALPLFREEALILSIMHDVAGVIPLLECGFIYPEEPQLPDEAKGEAANSFRGDVLRFGLDSIHNFTADLNTRVEQGWIPYLAIEKCAKEDNLLLLSDSSRTNGRFLPSLDGLVMAIQICEILEIAHSRNIIYRDHKILHYYWRSMYNGVIMIDWNVAKRFPQGLSNAETQFDLVQFGARALHYILTGRAARGALPLGPNRPDEIEAAARSYSVDWTYDDQRLPKDIKDVLEATLSGKFTSARQLKEELIIVYDKLKALLDEAGG